MRGIFTHGACVVAGIALAVAMGARKKEVDFKKAGADSERAEVRSDVPDRPGRPVEKKDPQSGEVGRKGTGEFKEAWEMIAARDLTIAERLEMQIGVLKEWSMVDMEGAMRAALENAWDGDAAKGGISPLMAAFDDAFKAQPLAAWDLLESGRLGVGTELFRQQWVNSAAETEPVFLFSVAEKIPAALRMHAIQMAMRSAARSPELKEEMIRKLSDLPDTPSANNYIGIAFNALPANEGNAAEIRGRLTAATNERAKTILLHEFSSTLREASAAVISDEWSKLPAEMQKRAAMAFFNGEQGTRNAPSVLDMLMDTDQWSIAVKASDRLIEYGRTTTAPEELAEWGMTLPERAETGELFRRSIEPLINRNNAAAKEWLAELPAGDWKTERALYFYTQNALYARNDEALFQWAVDRMTDPDLKKSAERSHGGWLQRRGLGGKAK